MVSLADINAYLEKKGIRPVDRNTLYSDSDELRQFGLEIMTDVVNGKNCPTWEFTHILASV